MSHDPPIELLGTETVYAGSQVSVRVGRFRHADGEEVEREYVHRVSAAAIVAYDDEHVLLVRQPREAILQYTLEVPAGKLDVEGETALETAQRELAEETGQAAEHWTEIECYYPSSGYSDELVHVFAATGLRPSGDAEPDASERIDVVRWPLADLDAALAATNDAKTLIALAWLRTVV
jgi:8-oxo-dGTP pyrophosphatase MutT (NUDIX family)